MNPSIDLGFFVVKNHFNVSFLSHTIVQRDVGHSPQNKTHISQFHLAKIYIFYIFTISSNEEMYTEECAHSQSNTVFF